MTNKIIYCCGCNKHVSARLTTGLEVYMHASDLSLLPFWICDKCKNFVGCHHKTRDRTRPLGCIATFEIKIARREIHKILDPLWKENKIKRKNLYKLISEKIGWQYHTAKIKSIEEAREVYKVIKEIEKNYDA